MEAAFKWDTREFERAAAQIANESDRTDHEIITMNAKTLLKAVVFNTPMQTGTLRAGFWPAWTALDMPGSPGTRRAYAPWKQYNRRYVPDGRVDDQRSKRGEAYFEFANSTHYYGRGGRVNYPYMLNAKKNFMGRAEAEATFKFGRGYEKLLKKHGKL